MWRRILNKYFQIPIAAKAAFWFTFCSVVQQVINFVTVPIFTRMLSFNDYGVWTIYSTWSSLLSIIVTLNLAGGGFNNAMLKYEGKRNEYVSSMVGLDFFLVLVWSIIAYVFRGRISSFINLPTQYIFTMLISTFFNTIFNLWVQKNRYELKYKSLLLVSIIVSVMVPTCGIFAVLNSNNQISARINSNVAVYIAAYTVLAIYILKQGREVYNKNYWGFALRFNIPLIPHYLSQIVLSQSDRVMIGNISSESDAAFYGVAYSVANIILIVVNGVTTALGPWMYERLSNKQTAGISQVINKLAIFFGILVLVPILMGQEVISIMGPKEYQSAIWVIPPVATSVYFQFVYAVYSCIEFYYERKEMIAIGSIMTAIVNIILNYLFINEFGYIAAGYTTLFCYVLYAICHCVFSNKVQKINNIKNVLDDKFLFSFAFFIVTVSLLCNFLYINSILRYILIIVLGVLCFAKRDDLTHLLRIFK